MERAVIAAVYPKGTSDTLIKGQLQELSGLLFQAGAQVMGTLTQARLSPGSGLGRGALEELRAMVRNLDASLVVFDRSFSAGKLAEVQQFLGGAVRVIDRTQVILDIFAGRAKSREARVQVALAQYRYLEPLLKGRGGFSRQRGGIGTRGPGETRLELDRRVIRQRIKHLSHQLDQIEQQRHSQRRRRGRSDLPLIALVGYTNVGKSTLFSLLTHRSQPAQDAMFSTLDSTVRRLLIPGFGFALLADTVGFVDRLPHDLVAAFRSTLAEVKSADLLLEVVSGDPEFPVSMADQQEVIAGTLRDLGADHIARVVAVSQSDRALLGQKGLRNVGIPVSALVPFGIDTLIKGIGSAIQDLYRDATVQVPWEAHEAWRVIFREFVIVERKDHLNGVDLRIRGPESAFFLLRQSLQHFRDADLVLE